MPRTIRHGLTSFISALSLVLCAGLLALPATAAPTYTVLHNFTGVDGSNSIGGLLQDSNGVLYGETADGGAFGSGTIWAQSTTAATFSDLHNFNQTDGTSPVAGLRNIFGDFHRSGRDLGVTAADGLFGGRLNFGTVFSSDQAGNVATLHVFTGNPDGATPLGRLLPWFDGYYYGTTSTGGGSDNGTVYRIKPNGSGYAILHRFTGGLDGAGPGSGLQYGSDGNFYGSTTGGGSFGSGVVYRISPSGAFKVIWNFTGGSDGATPFAALVTDFNGSLYGATTSGGAGGNGTLFRITQSGALSTLFAFAADGSSGQSVLAQLSIVDNGDNGDRAHRTRSRSLESPDALQRIPTMRPLQNDEMLVLYGVAQNNGPGGNGVVFAFDLTTNVYSIVHSFAGADGAFPATKLLTSADGNIYGTTTGGGLNGAGVVFSLSGVLSGPAFPFTPTPRPRIR